MFIPDYVKEHGEQNGILILDNCRSKFVLEKDVISAWLTIIYLPPNLTSWHQPADQGIIKSVKTVYKTQILRSLLTIYDSEPCCINRSF